MDLSVQEITKLNKFRERVGGSRCSRCELNAMMPEGRMPVTGKGMGRIMFVSMSPSVEEHTSQASKHNGVFNAMVRSEVSKLSGINVDMDAYVTTLVKCHPDQLTGYKSTHRKACSKHLIEEIQIVNPVIIVFLGKEVFTSVCYAEDFKGHGIPFKATVFGKEYWVMVTNNPALIVKDVTQYKMFSMQIRVLAGWLNDELDFYTKRGIPQPKLISNYRFKRDYVVIDSKEAANEAYKRMESEATLIDGKKYLTLDTETTGLDLFVPSFDIVGLSLAVNETTGYYIPIGHANHPKSLVKLPIKQMSLNDAFQFVQFLIRSYVLIFHNFQYDYRVLNKFKFKVPFIDVANDVWYHDTMLMAYLCNENDKLGLKDQSFMRFGYAAKKFTDVVEDSNFKYTKIETAAKYAGDDAVSTWKLFETLRPILVSKSEKQTDGKLLSRIYPEELKVMRVMSDAQDYGMAVDIEYLNDLHDRLSKEAKSLFNELDSICNTITHSSSSQLVHMLDDIIKSAKDAAEGTADASLDDIEFDITASEDSLHQIEGLVTSSSKTFRWTEEKLHKYISVLLTYRKVMKLLSTYVSMRDRAKFDDNGNYIIHGEFKTIGTTSGRMSSRHPNLQNIPRDTVKPPKKCSHCGLTDSDVITSTLTGSVVADIKKTLPWYSSTDKTGGIFTCRKCGLTTSNYQADIRRAFVARKNKVFVTSDWSSMEMNVCGAVSADKKLLEILNGQRVDPKNPNFDMHRVTASAMYHVPVLEVTADQRQNAKPVNFGAIYLISEIGLANNLRIQAGLHVTKDEALSFLDGFFSTYPGIKLNWIVPGKRLLATQHYITHPYGRIRHISKSATGEEVRSALNFTIQGWCASIMKEAVNKIFYEGVQHIKEANLISVIHDEIIVECYPEDVAQVVKIMYDAMNIYIEDKARVLLMAEEAIKYNLSKAAKSYTLKEFKELLKE